MNAGVASTTRLETLSQWLSASVQARELALQATLGQIKALDPSIHAWVQVLPQEPTGTGALSGIPFGAKDVIETLGLSTEYGSAVYKGRLGKMDAAIVTFLRQRGGVLLGKTRCTAFAYFEPASTRNPRDLEHTPGGSSSGSAAAVAAGMVPVALGTQTRGSVLRPASFCGVTGFKPTFDLLPMEGVLPLSKSQDTLGLFTHTPADMLALWDAMGHATGSDEEFAIGIAEPRQEVEPAMAAAFESALNALRKTGIKLVPLDIAALLAKLTDAGKDVMYFEGSRFHEQRFKEFGTKLDSHIVELIQTGLKMPVEQYDEARRFIAGWKSRFTETFKATPILLTPAAPGPAPLGLASTGNPRMNAPWTSLGTPAISIPMPISDGLPLGLQIVADRGQDACVLRTAVRIQQILNSHANQ